MNPMMTGRIEDPFKPSRQFINCLGVNPKLVSQVNTDHGEHHDRVKA